MSKKNKHRHQQRNQQASVSGSLTPNANHTTPLVEAALPQTPESAARMIDSAHQAAVGAAQDADLQIAMSIDDPINVATFDTVAAAKQVKEIIALCTSREERCTSREATYQQREYQLTAREGELALLSAEIEKARLGVDADKKEVQEFEESIKAREKELEERESAARKRELNAEAGFAAERRASLRMLEEEAGILRDELSKARSQIASERAKWEQEIRAEDERRREEVLQLRSKQAEGVSALEREAEERIRVEREQLAKDRLDLKKRAAQVQAEQEILQEDREAFDERVARRAANEIETGKARQKDLKDRLASAQKERDELYEKLRLRDEAERVLGNRPLPELKRELDDLRNSRDVLMRQLSERPKQDVAERLVVLERAREEWESERSRLIQEAIAAKTAQAKAAIAVTELETLRDQKASLESARDLLHTAIEELRKDVDDRIRRADGLSPFPACSQMDNNSALQTQCPGTDEVPDLKALCQELQHRIAIDPANPQKVLLYELRDIRCFVAGLAMSRLHLLQGISGTGKTSLPRAVARALGGGSTLVEVQAGWRDRQDLIGHFNAFERRFYESEFLQALYRAQCPRNSGILNFVILDEMNLSHPEQYFADLLSALEQDPHLQKLDLMTAPVEPAPKHLCNGRTLMIPQNVWFVGTANHDETTKDFADKTYDRAHVMELPRNRAKFQPQRLPIRAPITFEALRASFDKAQQIHEAKAKEAYGFLENSFSELLGKRFGIGWGNRLERQLLDFVPVVIAAGGTVAEAVDHILASKLLRKVKDRHDTRPEDLAALNEKISEVWPKLDKSANAVRSASIVCEELRRMGAEEQS